MRMNTTLWISYSFPCYIPPTMSLSEGTRLGSYEILNVRPYPGPGEKVQISNSGGSQPVWARDGRELFYRNGDQMMAVSVERGADFVAGQPSLVFEGDYEAGVGFWANYNVSPDGKSFVMIKRTTEPPREINVVLNWFEELKRLAPRN